MAVISTSREAGGLARPNDWQAPLSAESFQPGPKNNRSKGMRTIRRIAWNLLPPLTFVAMVGLWWAAVELFKIPSYLLPGPGGVFSRLVTDTAVLWAIVLMQLVPKIAVAPLFLVWLGFGIESKVLLTVLMTFFPLLLASISGFQILDDRLLYLTKSMGATRWQTFRYLRFPAALPVIFSGIKTSATIAATAAIVAEFVGANRGLGYVLLRGTSTMDIELVFAVLVVLTIVGIGINYIVEFCEWAMTPWQRAKNS
ncbi:MAG: ABC transporter permease subunit [Betaproteobacteria bacterium]|nr:MAG: ABC transporter permease subunit [Betaproteobacteria bacterium]